MQECHSQVAQVEYEGQTVADTMYQNSWQQTVEPFIDTCYHIGVNDDEGT